MKLYLYFKNNFILKKSLSGMSLFCESDGPSPPHGLNASSLFANFQFLYHTKVSICLYVRRLSPWTFWRLWKYVKKLLFEGIRFSLIKIREEAELWFISQVLQQSYENGDSVLIMNEKYRWEPLPLIWLKCIIGCLLVKNIRRLEDVLGFLEILWVWSSCIVEELFGIISIVKMKLTSKAFSRQFKICLVIRY